MVKVSIIIPTKNQIEILLISLEKAIELVSDSIEIILVNDGDEINLPDYILKKIKILNNDRKGVSKARNLGAKHANGDVLFFIDDDIWLNKNALNEIEFLRTKKYLIENVYCISWVYPPILVEQLTKSILGRYIIKHNYHTAIGRSHINITTKKYIIVDGVSSCSFVILKEIFFKIGGYNENIIFQGEDIDITDRLNKNNIPIFMDTNVEVYHNHSHKVEIETYLIRMNNGYDSELKAKKQGYLDVKKYPKNLKYYIYTFIFPLENFLLKCFKIMPNNILFDFISFKLINLLSGITLAKNIKKHLLK
jgi:glycosyltransferase involved in cell wall biosynthesis